MCPVEPSGTYLLQNVEGGGGKVFAAVVENGTVWTNGDKPFFAKYLAQAEIQERRDLG